MRRATYCDQYPNRFDPNIKITQYFKKSEKIKKL